MTSRWLRGKWVKLYKKTNQNKASGLSTLMLFIQYLQRNDGHCSYIWSHSVELFKVLQLSAEFRSTGKQFQICDLQKRLLFVPVAIATNGSSI